MGAEFSQSNIVEGEPGVAEPLFMMYSNISRSTAGNGVMSAASCVGTSVGIGRGVGDKKGES